MILGKNDSLEIITRRFITELFSGPDGLNISDSEFITNPALNLILKQDINLNKMLIQTISRTKRFRERIIEKLKYEGIIDINSSDLVILSEQDKEIENKIYEIYQSIILEELEREKLKIYFAIAENEYSNNEKVKSNQQDKVKDKVKHKGAFDYFSLMLRIADIAISIYENFKKKKTNSSPLVAAV